MITRKEASEIAAKAVAGLRASVELVVQEEKTLEREFGWVFFYTAKRYLETGDRRDLLPGTGPLAVERETGAVHFLSSSAPPGRVVEEFERRWKLARLA